MQELTREYNGPKGRYGNKARLNLWSAVISDELLSVEWVLSGTETSSNE